MICVSLTATTTEQALEQMAAAYAQADLVELRLDYLTDPQLGRLLAARRGPIIVTNRPEREGGKYQGEESSRIATLKRAKELGADYVDVELDCAAQLAECPGPGKLIVSYHNFTETPSDLDAIHGQICATGADIAKIAVMARDITDNLRVFDLLKQTKLPTVALCMGELGLISRLLAPKFGAFLTFASLDKG
ncbi:MAG: type I 3-dehydroquinate dehydratase, partial [Planctomycetes bacterium]|nr:type I 3-dehydroquinate dehydratase [Planctomycetota bacterium]